MCEKTAEFVDTAFITQFSLEKVTNDVYDALKLWKPIIRSASKLVWEIYRVTREPAQKGKNSWYRSTSKTVSKRVSVGRIKRFLSTNFFAEPQSCRADESRIIYFFNDVLAIPIVLEISCYFISFFMEETHPIVGNIDSPAIRMYHSKLKCQTILSPQTETAFLNSPFAAVIFTFTPYSLF